MPCELILSGVYIITYNEITNYKLFLQNIIYQNIDKNLIIYNNYVNKELVWSENHSVVLKNNLVNTPIDIINIIEDYIGKKECKFLYYFPVSDYDTTNCSFRKLQSSKITISTINNKYDGKNMLQIQKHTRVSIWCMCE